MTHLTTHSLNSDTSPHSLDVPDRGLDGDHADNGATAGMPVEAPFVEEGRLLRAVEGCLPARDVEHVRQALRYARELDALQRADAGSAAQPAARRWDVAYALGVAETMSDTIHIDAISLGAVLLYQAVQSQAIALNEARARLGGDYGEAVAQTIEHIERFDTLP